MQQKDVRHFIQHIKQALGHMKRMTALGECRVIPYTGDRCRGLVVGSRHVLCPQHSKTLVKAQECSLTCGFQEEEVWFCTLHAWAWEDGMSCLFYTFNSSYAWTLKMLDLHSLNFFYGNHICFQLIYSHGPIFTETHYKNSMKSNNINKVMNLTHYQRKAYPQ